VVVIEIILVCHQSKFFCTCCKIFRAMKAIYHFIIKLNRARKQTYTVGFSSQQPQRSDINALPLRHWMQQAFQPHTLNWKRLQTACREIKEDYGASQQHRCRNAVATGVLLAEKNCDLYQGYSKSPQLSAEALVELCRSRA
jgi:hypothetical protein